jgi:hypothetical protein
MRLSPAFICGSTIDFTLITNYNGTNAAQTFSFSVPTAPPLNTTTTLDTTAPSNGVNYTASTGTQTGRLVRTGVGSSCGTAKANPGLNDTTPNRRYDAYTFTALSSGCYTVTVTQGASLLYTAAYSGSFVPATPNTNFLADPGSSSTSMSYSFDAVAGQTYTIVVHEVTVGAGVGQSYTLNLSGPPLAGGCTVYAGPTAAAVSVSGSVRTSAGTGLRGAAVTMIDANGQLKTVVTNSFGSYSFDNVLAGQSYVVRASSKGYTFRPRALLVTDTLTNVDFINGQ